MRINRRFGYVFILAILLGNQLLITADKVPATVSSQLFAVKFPRLPKAPKAPIRDNIPHGPRGLPDDVPNAPKDGLEEPHNTRDLEGGSQVPVNIGSLDSQKLRSIAYTATVQAETRTIRDKFKQQVITKAHLQLAAQVAPALGVEIDPSLTIRNQVEEVTTTAAEKAADKKLNLGATDRDAYTTAKSVSEAISIQTYNDIQQIGKKVNKSAQDAAFQVVNSAVASKANRITVKKLAYEAAEEAAEKAAIEEIKRLRQEQRVVFITKTTLRALITGAALVAVYKAIEEDCQEEKCQEVPQN